MRNQIILYLLENVKFDTWHQGGKITVQQTAGNPPFGSDRQGTSSSSTRPRSKCATKFPATSRLRCDEFSRVLLLPLYESHTREAFPGEGDKMRPWNSSALIGNTWGRREGISKQKFTPNSDRVKTYNVRGGNEVACSYSHHQCDAVEHLNRQSWLKVGKTAVKPWFSTTGILTGLCT